MGRNSCDAIIVAEGPQSVETRGVRLRSIIGGSIGNLIEWYDFLIYSIFAVYFANSFFPQGDATAQLLNAAAVAAIGYIVRPLGSWLMGRYADRHGRRAALALSISLMCGQCRNTPRDTSPASSGPQAGRPCSAPKTWWGCVMDTSSLRATVGCERQ